LYACGVQTSIFLLSSISMSSISEKCMKAAKFVEKTFFVSLHKNLRYIYVSKSCKGSSRSTFGEDSGL